MLVRVMFDQPVDLRMRVVAEPIRLFAAQGYESTIPSTRSRRRRGVAADAVPQFRSKEDVIFADHEALLDSGRAAAPTASVIPMNLFVRQRESVFAHFRSAPDRRSRAAGGRRGAALRDRELIATYRYQRAFEDHLVGAGFRERSQAARRVRGGGDRLAQPCAGCTMLRAMSLRRPPGSIPNWRCCVTRWHRVPPMESGFGRRSKETGGHRRDLSGGNRPMKWARQVADRLRQR